MSDVAGFWVEVTSEEVSGRAEAEGVKAFRVVSTDAPVIHFGEGLVAVERGKLKGVPGIRFRRLEVAGEIGAKALEENARETFAILTFTTEEQADAAWRVFTGRKAEDGQ